MLYCRLLLFFPGTTFFLWVVVGCWQKTPVCMTLFLGPHMNPETGLKERPPRVPKQPPRAPRQQPGTPIQQPESPKQQQAPDLARWEQGHEDSDLGHKASYKLPELPELSEQTRQSKARRGKARQGEARNMSHQGSNMRHQSSNQEALKAISMFVGRFWTEI